MISVGQEKHVKLTSVLDTIVVAQTAHFRSLINLSVFKTAAGTVFASTITASVTLVGLDSLATFNVALDTLSAFPVIPIAVVMAFVTTTILVLATWAGLASIVLICLVYLTVMAMEIVEMAHVFVTLDF